MFANSKKHVFYLMNIKVRLPVRGRRQRDTRDDFFLHLLYFPVCDRAKPCRMPTVQNLHHAKPDIIIIVKLPRLACGKCP